MPLIISGTITTVLGVSGAEDPVIITATGYLADGIVASTSVSITNLGVILGEVNLGKGGSFFNGVNALVSNGSPLEAAIANESQSLTVTNAGVIYGSGYSLLLNDGGDVINQASGVIDGRVRFINGPGIVTNAGAISGNAHGVGLEGGGGVTNLTTGTISGPGYGLYIATFAGTVTNAGTITGTNQYGVWLKSGGGVSNQGAGAINGGDTGIYIAGAAGTVTNAGSIAARSDFGVWLKAGGEVTNQPSGTISGADLAIYIGAGAENVTNAGDLVGTNDGVFANSPSGGSVTNLRTGTISVSVASGILFQNAAGTVTNAGTISGSGSSLPIYGVWLTDGGSVTNQITGVIEQAATGVQVSNGGANVTNTGVIAGGGSGVVLDAGGTVTNAGMISGDAAAVLFAAGFANRLIVDPGAVFSGAVNGGDTIGASGVSTLELASGTATGTLSGLGTQFTNFAAVTIDAAASWTLTGTNTLPAGSLLVQGGVLTDLDGALSDAGGVINNGLIQVDTATLTVGTLSGFGQVLIGTDSTLAATGAVAAGETIVFLGDGLLDLAPAAFQGQIENLAGGDIIELAGIADATSAAIVNGNTLAVQQSSGPAFDLTLAADQSYSGIDFSILAPAGPFGSNDVIDVTGPAGPLIISGGGSDTLTGAEATTLAATANGLGGITVTGANSLLTTITDAFLVGDTSVGSLAVEAGGTANAQGGMIVANGGGGSGSSVDVSGAGSNLIVNGTLIVGDAGSGALSLSQGASATTGGLDLGAAATGDGDVSLAGTGTTSDITGSLTLGDQAAGELSILGGAQMTIGTGGVVGSSKTAPGNLDVEGAGSLLTINSGTLTVGANGPAEFTLGIGATLRGEVANGPFGVVNEYGNVDPPTDPNDGTQNVGFGNSLIYDFFVANSGTIKITSGSATFYTPLVTDETNAADGSTNGLWVIGAHDTLVMNATSVDNTQTFDFTSPSAASLVIGQVPRASTTSFDTFNGQTMPSLTGSIAPGAANVLPGWNAPIENYQSGDVIVLQGLTYGSATASGDVVTVWAGASGTGSILGSLTFLSKSLAPSSAEASAAAAQINSLACFAAGTRIATERGWVRVEDLCVGDAVVTAQGPRDPVVWVGSRAVDCARHPRPETVWPVRIARGAFGENVPARDLYLSPDHAVFLNGVLVPVKLLINGTSITQVKRNHIVYYHVELPEHAVILAERLPVESYLEIGDRADFDGTGTIRLFPDFGMALAPETAVVWETRGAAALVMAGEALARARRLLAAQGPRQLCRSRAATPSGSRPPRG